MVKDFDLVFIGHFAIDTIFYRGVESHSIGGGVTYGSLAAYCYNNNLKIGICSIVGKDFDVNSIEELFDKSINLDGIKNSSERSTNYFLEYHNGSRILTLKARADDISFNDMPENFKNSKYFMLAPIANEIPKEFADKLIENTSADIGIDVQGFIRKFNPNGTIDKNPDKKIIENLKYIINKCNGRLVLKASEEEANYISRKNDIIKSTEELARTNNAIVLSTLGPKGSFIKYKENKIVHIPAFQPNKIVDETGAGDCYSAVFLSELINTKSTKTIENIVNAGYYASAASSFLLEEKGPKGFGSKNKVKERIKKNRIIEIKK